MAKISRNQKNDLQYRKLMRARAVRRKTHMYYRKRAFKIATQRKHQMYIEPANKSMIEVILENAEEANIPRGTKQRYGRGYKPNLPAGHKHNEKYVAVSIGDPPDSSGDTGGGTIIVLFNRLKHHMRR